MTKTLADIAHLYEENLQEHGAGARSVGWKADDEQALRFDRLCRVFGSEPERSRKADDDSPISIADLGCGYGAMFDYLASRSDLTISAYYGYDIAEPMLEAARSRIADERAHWISGSKILHEVDYSFVSGSFNVRFEASDEDWKAYIQAAILELAQHSRRGLAFNLLSTYVDWKESHLFYGDPLEFFDFCKRRLSRFVTLIHDYPLYEWTIVVHDPKVS